MPGGPAWVSADSACVEQPAVGGVEAGLRRAPARPPRRRRRSRTRPRRESFHRGRSRTRTQASVITPRMPSDPSSRRSGLGPAPDPGSRRLSQIAGRGHRPDRLDQVVDVCVERWRSVRRPGWRSSRPGSRTRTTAGSGAGSGRARRAGPRGPARAPPPGSARRPRRRSTSSTRSRRAEVDRDRAAIAVAHPGLDSADDARSAPVGDRRQPSLGAPVQHLLDLALIARMRHQVGRVSNWPRKPRTTSR